MELSQAHLRYLLAIGELSQGKAAVSSAAVARALGVSCPSVTRMLAVLAEKDLVTKERYGKITLTETGAALAHQLQAGLRDLERRLPALGLDLDREETAAVAGALASVLPEHCLRRDNGMCHALKKQSCGFCRRTASFLEHRTIKEI